MSNSLNFKSFRYPASSPTVPPASCSTTSVQHSKTRRGKASPSGEPSKSCLYTYSPGTNRLAFWTGGSYSYNAAGCVTHIERIGRPTLDLAWNGQCQLVSVRRNGVFLERYSYDALGQTYYPLTDIQGTVWGYADSANNVVARWTYDAWGNVLSEVCTVPALATLRYRFQGREWSAATGLINFRMRWYDPDTGRWLSKDPIGLGGGLNLYAFCGNAPVIICDS